MREQIVCRLVPWWSAVRKGSDTRTVSLNSEALRRIPWRWAILLVWNIGRSQAATRLGVTLESTTVMSPVRCRLHIALWRRR